MMISRALFRLRSPIIHSLNASKPLSSSAPHNASGQPHSNPAAATPESSVVADARNRKYGRPSTVTWSQRLHNSVSLIGTVEYPLKRYDSQNERFGVFTLLLVKTSPDSDNSFRITLEMWDELAERALLHLKQNDYIFVSGELGSYTKVTAAGIESLRYKVTAKELNYVKLDEPGKISQQAVNPEKETGEHLGESSLQKYNNRLHLWQILFANPNEWYDNRKSKKNPRQPDFKHKSTGEALWLSERDPPWVKKQVELLDSGLSGGPNNDVISNFFPSGCETDEQLMMPNPAVTAKDLNKVKPDDPGKNSQRVVNSGKETGESSSQKYDNRFHLWEKLFANPNEWYDNRKSKRNPKQPDFKHKSTGEVLWLSERDPSWVKKQVESLDSRLPGGDFQNFQEVTSKTSSSRWVSGELL